MSEDLIRYDLLVQDALKGVVRKILGDAVKNGLSGDHHFYISFRTDFPGVRLSNRLREKYPQEMTIILQHQFWDLGVTEHAFEVGLSFSGIPERLLVPFEAVTGFFDPSVQFGLKFEVSETAQERQDDPSVATTVNRSARGAASEPAEITPKNPTVSVPAKSTPPKLPARSVSDEGKADKASKPAEVARTEESTEASASGAEVVSLDAFRKKN
jgi:uncharacterized protein